MSPHTVVDPVPVAVHHPRPCRRSPTVATKARHRWPERKSNRSSPADTFPDKGCFGVHVTTMTRDVNNAENERRPPGIEAFLRSAGAGDMPHPGGTLLDHLRRVACLLADWGADPVVQVAGLCHAAYGTDGFGQRLLPHTERGTLAALIGTREEALVYLYGSCDRDFVYPRLGTGGPVVFRDRFTGDEHVPADADLRAFTEITAANELDVLAHNADLAARYGADLRRLFTRCRDLLTPEAWRACADLLGPA